MHNDFPKLSNLVNIESSSISFSKKTNPIHLIITRLVLNQNHLHFFKLMTLSLLTGGEWCHFLQRCFYLNTKPPSMNAKFTLPPPKKLLYSAVNNSYASTMSCGDPRYIVLKIGPWIERPQTSHDLRL